MAIPTEPIGSVPRPAYLIEAAAEAAGRQDDPGLVAATERAVMETVAAMEATGSPVITDGEQSKPSFATYPLVGLETLAPDGLKIVFADGHVRYQECLAIRERTALPFVLDENIDGLPVLLQGLEDRAFDAINLKISKLGGLTKARLIRDICIEAGVAMTIEDTWGGDFVTAAIAHLAQSTPDEFLLSSTDFNSYGTRKIADGAPQRVQGRMAASDTPGLGCTPIMAELGAPVFKIGGSE